MKSINLISICLLVVIFFPVCRKKLNESANKQSGLIALTLRDQNGKLQIFTINPDGANRKQLTFEGESGRPDWSPDGKKIVCMSIRNGVGIWVMNEDGTNQQFLAEGVAPDWSPDETQMVFIMPKNPTSQSDPQPEIGVMNVDGTNERILTTADRINTDGNGGFCETANDANAPSWSPVENKIAFW